MREEMTLAGENVSSCPAVLSHIFVTHNVRSQKAKPNQAKTLPLIVAICQAKSTTPSRQIRESTNPSLLSSSLFFSDAVCVLCACTLHRGRQEKSKDRKGLYYIFAIAFNKVYLYTFPNRKFFSSLVSFKSVLWPNKPSPQQNTIKDAVVSRRYVVWQDSKAPLLVSY